MNSKNFILNIPITYVVVLLAFTVVFGGCSKPGPPPIELLAPAFQAEKISHIEIQTQYGMLNLRKTAEHWVIQERQNYPASTLSIAGILNQLESIRVMDRVAVNSNKQWGEFGLKDPSEHADEQTGTRLRVSGSEGYQLDMIIGHIIDSGSDESRHFGQEFDGNRYARLYGRNEALIISDSLSTVNTLPNFWIDSRFFKKAPVVALEYFEGSELQWKISRKSKADPFACIYRGQVKQLPNITLMFDSLMYEVQLDDVLPQQQKTNVSEGFSHSFLFTTQDEVRYRMHIGKLVPIPDEETRLLGNATGMLVPALFDSRRMILIEGLPGGAGVTSLQRKVGIPYFNTPYLVNHPQLGRLLLNLDQLILYDRIIKEKTE